MKSIILTFSSAIIAIALSNCAASVSLNPQRGAATGAVSGAESGAAIGGNNNGR